MTEPTDNLRDTLRVQRSIIKHYRRRCRRLERVLKSECYKAWWEETEFLNDELVEQLAEKDANMMLVMNKLEESIKRERHRHDDLEWAINWTTQVLDKLKNRQRSET